MTPFRWRKLGRVFDPTNRAPWMQSHAQVPFAVVLPDRLRVYVSTRGAREADGQFTSHSAWVDLDRSDPMQILAVADQPLIDLGGPGEFDQHGSMAGSVVRIGDRFRLYFCGWTRQQSVPYNWAIGVAESVDGKRFRKLGPGPLLGPTLVEPYLQACPIVQRDADGTWRMFYLSGLGWLLDGPKPESVYRLMQATSRDGLTWQRDAQTIIPPLVEHECQTSATILHRDGRHHLFFSYRHGLGFRDDSQRGYRIGYAVSDDLIHWTRDDRHAGLEPTPGAWDGRMVCYPHLCQVDDRTLLFYCGDGFGRDGFGVAELVG